jgi:protein gp37
MGYPTPIEWTDATWNPIGGCSIKSPGCGPCYAQQLAGTRLKNHPLYAGTTTVVKGKPVFNGMMTAADDDHPVWTWPLRWRGAKHPVMGAGKPSLIFVGDMSDLFHENRDELDIGQVVAVGMCSHHVMQMLTKRADRMAELMTSKSFCMLVDAYVDELVMDNSDPHARRSDDLRATAPDLDCGAPIPPQPNIWLGFSAERQKEFDERWPHMRKLAQLGWTIFLSYEPAIGPLILPAGFLELGPRAQVIAGGMSGKEAQPAHPAWFRAVRDQCAAAGVPFFFKQWGEWHADALLTTEARPGGRCPPPNMRIGRKAAGRLLDGVENNGFPAIVAGAPASTVAA